MFGMIRKFCKTWIWFKRFRKTQAKYPVFRREVWAKYDELTEKEDLSGVKVGSLFCVLVFIILIILEVNLLAENAKIMKWLNLAFIAVAVWTLLANLVRLSEPLKKASEYAVEQVREARGDYVVHNDDGDDDDAAEPQTRRSVHATRRRRSPTR